MLFPQFSELPDPTLIIDPITEERASRTLYRIELLRRIREQVLPHPLLAERLKLCQPSQDLPEWWECGRHDRDLLVGASKHGVSRTDYHILNDPSLAFLEAHQRYTSQRGAGASVGAQGELAKAGTEAASAPLLTPAELASAAAAAEAAAKEGEMEGKDVNMDEERAEMEMNIKTEGEDVDSISCIKIETCCDLEGNQGEVHEMKDETLGSPMKEVKTEETQLKVENQEAEAHREERSEEEEAFKSEKDLGKDLTVETLMPEDGKQKDTSSEVLEDAATAGKVELVHKTTDEEEEDRDNPENPKTPKSADTERSPEEEEEEEERLDDDDKSEKSSQAEGISTE